MASTQALSSAATPQRALLTWPAPPRRPRLQEVRRREWDDAARRALSSRANTLTALNELAATAVELGAEDTQLALALR